MATMDASHIGRFGTLSVMKTSSPAVSVAHFPIDEEEITIGRDPSCSVRLYYETVSRLHCKITFQDRKAFLVVLGASGLIADGCTIFPTSIGPTTVPLGNESEIEVHRKIFRFTYPPKELRPIILSTPEPDRTRRRSTLRMSMIQSAQVFSPAPSNDPRENLRVLQSPIKSRFPSPLKPSISTPVIEEEEEDIILVDGSNPSVVQDDDNDLVILENVQTPPAPLNIPARSVQFQQYQTPVRKARSSLHRAVLIRSAQRVARKIELEADDIQEEREVEEVVAAIEDEGVAPDIEPERLDGDILENGEQTQEVQYNYRQLGAFMTPQGPSRQPVRDRAGYSVEGPRRVRVVQPWKVKDIVIPPDAGVKQEEIAHVLRKERITDEERQAIRERRKSALKIPDPADLHIPGSRRTSSIVPPALFSSPVKGGSFSTEDSKANVHMEEDTSVLLAKMKTMVQDMKRRKSIGANLSPTKGDAEEAFWGSGSHVRFMSKDVAEVPEEDNPPYMHVVPHSEHTTVRPNQDDAIALDSDEADEEEVERQTTPTRSVPLRTTTPRMESVKPVPQKPREFGTPAFSGMKRLFARDGLKTPAYTGVKNMFHNGGDISTPGFEGIGDMLATPIGYGIKDKKDDAGILVDSDMAQVNSMEINKEVVIHKRKLVQDETRMETSSPELAEPRKILRNLKLSSSKTASVPRLTRARKAGPVDAKAMNKLVPQSEPPQKTRSLKGGNDRDTIVPAHRTLRNVPESSATAQMQKPPATRRTRTRTTPIPAQESGSEGESVNTKSVKSSVGRRGTRAKPINIEEPMEVEDQSVAPAARVKRGGRGKRSDLAKEEEDTPVLNDLVTMTKGHALSKSAAKAPDNPVAKVEKENTPEMKVDDNEDSTEPNAPPPSKVTRTRRVVAKTPVVKDEQKDIKVPRRGTRSRK